jgi:hypothetical protein
MAQTDPGLAAIRSALGAHFAGLDPSAKFTVEHGWKDNIHIRVISQHFESMKMGERNAAMRPVLKALPPEIRLRISLTMWLTPNEYAEAYGVPKRTHAVSAGR